MATERPARRNGPTLSFHPLQLTTVAAHRVAARLRPTREGDPDEPMVDAGQVSNIALAANGEGFRCRVRIVILVPVLEGSVFRGDVTMETQFVAISDAPLTISIARAFARRQALYLAWPFARAYLDQLAMMTGVAVPPLPLLLVPRADGDQ